jgi:hypothetical protein
VNSRARIPLSAHNNPSTPPSAPRPKESVTIDTDSDLQMVGIGDKLLVTLVPAIHPRSDPITKPARVAPKAVSKKGTRAASKKAARAVSKKAARARAKAASAKDAADKVMADALAKAKAASDAKAKAKAAADAKAKAAADADAEAAPGCQGCCEG